jgi:hypothetical protein
MAESYMLLFEVLRSFKEGTQQLPKAFQDFARGFADQCDLFALYSPTKGGVVTGCYRLLHADDGVSHYVGAVVRLMQFMLCLIVIEECTANGIIIGCLFQAFQLFFSSKSALKNVESPQLFCNLLYVC